MATVSAARAAATQPRYTGRGGGQLCFEWGVYEIASALSAADIIEFCTLPPCTVVDGMLNGDDLDTNATELLELDIGHAGNATDTADPDAFLNSGVLNGDAVTNVKPEVGLQMRLQGTLVGGPVVLAEETMCQAVMTAAAATGGTGTVWAGFFYVTD